MFVSIIQPCCNGNCMVIIQSNCGTISTEVRSIEVDIAPQFQRTMTMQSPIHPIKEGGNHIVIQKMICPVLKGIHGKTHSLAYPLASKNSKNCITHIPFQRDGVWWSLHPTPLKGYVCNERLHTPFRGRMGEYTVAILRDVLHLNFSEWWLCNHHYTL